MKIKIGGLDITVNIKNDNIINNNINNILRSVKISLKRNHNISFDEYLDIMGFNLEKCNICKNEKARYDVDFIISGDEFSVKNISYKKYYCYSKNKKCPGKKMNPNSVEFISKSMKISKQKALEYIHQNNSTPFYLSNHGSVEDYKKSQTRDINFFGSRDNYEEWKDKLKRGHKIETYIKKYGKGEGERIWKEIQSKKESCSLKFYLKKFNGDEKKALEEYSERLKKVIPNSSSKEAEKFFKELTKEVIINFGIKEEDILTFYKDNKELNIVYYFYDYCITSHKIIIEYNGKLWHPDKKYYTKEEWDSWKHPFNEGLTADMVYKKDKQKLAIALSRGYKLIKVWSDVGVDDNIKFVIEKIRKYING